jgi:hypothetical protein
VAVAAMAAVAAAVAWGKWSFSVVGSWILKRRQVLDTGEAGSSAIDAIDFIGIQEHFWSRLLPHPMCGSVGACPEKEFLGWVTFHCCCSLRSWLGCVRHCGSAVG